MRTRLARAAPWVALGCLVVTLWLAYWGKAVCIDGETGFWAQTRYCYSDVRVLWSFRGFDVDALPYLPPPPGYPEAYVTEYPPLLAFPAAVIALLTETRRAFFVAHAATFAVAAFATLVLLVWSLRRRGQPPWRLLGFALSPALVLFGMLNWDLWAVALAAAGLHAAVRGRTTAAAVWFGLGAATKWWPGLLAVTLVAGPWRRSARSGGRRLDLRPLGTTVGVWALAQLPAIVVSPAGWWASIRFHLGRLPNYDSLASAITAAGEWVAPGRFWGDPFAALYTVVSLVILAAGVVYVGWRLREGTLDPADGCLALVALFLLTSKVFSPQFVLWLLPVAVLARTSWTPVLAVEAANAAVWLVFGPWMAHLGDPAFSGFLRAAQALTVVRAGALAWLLVAALLPRRDASDGERPVAPPPRWRSGAASGREVRSVP